MFNVDDYISQKYYKQIFDEIKSFQLFNLKSLTPRRQKFEKIKQCD